jgi:hypothetical protein
MVEPESECFSFAMKFRIVMATKAFFLLKKNCQSQHILGKTNLKLEVQPKQSRILK